jgi:inosine/xanthosine triphosphatase
MLVAVGTSNPVKVKAVANVLSSFFEVTTTMKNVSSGVPPQPIGLEITLKGAIMRATAALEAEKAADLGVGIEAGLVAIPSTISGYMDQQFAAIVDCTGRITIGAGPSFEYPKVVVDRIFKEGIEANTAMVDLSGVDAIGHKQGAIGHFSKGRMDRTRLTELAVLMAMIPRLNEEIYFARSF